ncbi:MAG: exonuclease SbcCD subunit D [Lachnospiraceae bacterium]
MKFIHLSDLHLGKRVNEFSMIEDQKHILLQTINIIDDEKPDAVIIAGDIYDKSIPSEEAMLLFDDFLLRLSKRNISVFVISGNHDSSVRLSDHSKLVVNQGIYLSPVYDGTLKPVSMEDEYGEINVYMLPFIKPVAVKQYFGDEEILSYTDAVRVAIKHMNVDCNKRNVLVAHQFVLGAATCESEEHIVGGLDSVSSDVFDCFDYVALGHIHGKQYIGRETVRYCGTLLKYSFSEKNHVKSVTVVDIKEKGNIDIREVMLTPKRDLREIKGSYEDITNRKNYEGTNVDDYVHIVLTDEEDVIDAIGKLRTIYPNIMKLSYDNKRTRENNVLTEAGAIEEKSPLELFEDFYSMQNNVSMSPWQTDYVKELIEEIWGN